MLFINDMIQDCYSVIDLGLQRPIFILTVSGTFATTLCGGNLFWQLLWRWCGLGLWLVIVSFPRFARLGCLFICPSTGQVTLPVSCTEVLPGFYYQVTFLYSLKNCRAHFEVCKRKPTADEAEVKRAHAVAWAGIVMRSTTSQTTNPGNGQLMVKVVTLRTQPFISFISASVS